MTQTDKTITSAQGRPGLFLDRDGVINVEKNYVGQVEDFEFMDGIFDLVRTAIALGLTPVVITNQAGIARGYYSEAQFLALTHWMCEQFEAQGATLAAVYYCPYHPAKGLGEYLKDSPDRKPNPGMIFRARDELGLDLARSFLIGDKLSDIEAGKNAGIIQNYLLSTDEVNCSASLQRVTSLPEAATAIHKKLRCIDD